jgi:CxxC-x17-CxxC domain-containing protein
MGKFNRDGNRFERKPSFGGGRDGGRPNFQKKQWGAQGPKEMFQAVCAKCSKPCEVPFRPSGDKPVYCKDCFVRKDGGDNRGFQKPRFDKPRFDRPQFENAGKGNGDVLKKIEGLEAKIDRLTRAVEVLSGGRPTFEKTEVKSIEKPKDVETVAKNSTKKTKKTFKKKGK